MELYKTVRNSAEVTNIIEKSRFIAYVKPVYSKEEADAFVAAPKWLERDKNTLQGKVIAMPTKEDIDFEIAENLIVELYSK